MRAFLSIVIAAAAGCSGVTMSGSPPDDDDTLSGVGSLHGTMYDEREDWIEFSTGEPVHTHRGVPTVLGDGCPAIYKFGYLTSEGGPGFGRELTPNPLAWQVDAGSTALEAAYRVRGFGGALNDWTPIAPEADGGYTIVLHRDGVHAVPEIATETGMMWIEARFRDAEGRETIKSACWDNHPLAAPLSFAPATRGDLFDESFANHSKISRLLNPLDGGIGVPVVTIPFQQLTQERIELAFDLGALPGGTGTKEVVNAFLVADPMPVVEPCDACATVAPLSTHQTDRTPIGGAWRMAVVDLTTGAHVCHSGAGHTVLEGCTIPPRGAIQASYELVVALAEEPSVTPDVIINDAPPFVDTAIGDRWLTGLPKIDEVQACSHHWVDPVDASVHCNEVSTYVQAVILDQAKLELAPIDFAISTGVTGAAMAPATYVPAATATFGAATWDSGNAGF